MEIKKLIRKYIVSDLVVSITMWIVFYYFCVVEDASIIKIDFSDIWLLLFYTICSLFTAYLTGFYNQKIARSRIVELISTLAGTTILSLIIFFSLIVSNVVVPRNLSYFQSFLVIWGIQFFPMYFSRFFITQHYFSFIKKGKLHFNTLIIGTGEIAEELVQNIRKKIRYYGANIVGCVRTNSKPKKISGKIVGSISKIDNIIKQQAIHSIIIALDEDDYDSTFDIIRRVIKYQEIDLSIVPRQSNIITERTTMNDVDFVPLINLSDLAMPAWQSSVKRIFDILISLGAIIILFPLLVFVGIWIKSTSKGSIFYQQERIGKNGEPFTIYKFRSMYENAEGNIPQLTQKNDERITPCGKILRKYRIDEIPQLFNILKGQMSIVGPRPERAYFIDQIIEVAPYYCLLYKIKPGLLSWGPIKVGYTHTIDEMKDRLNYDIVYMDNMSIFNDIKIIIYSIEVILKGKGT